MSLTRLAVLASVAGIALTTVVGAPAMAARPGAEEGSARWPAVEQAVPRSAGWVVSLGDSFISGEAGRWAGNESGTTAHVDALGDSAYWDNAQGTGEAIPRCHRSASALIHIGVVNSRNLACSGATTSTAIDSAGNFKPGIDFAHGPRGEGQAAMLQDFASTHDVRMVALSIGGNDFHFAKIIAQCVKDFLKPFSSALCQNDDDVKRYIDEHSVAKVRKDIQTAIGNVALAMERAGKKPGEWTLAVQLYPLPSSLASEMRYPQTGYQRQYDGGCGFTDEDLNWAAKRFLPSVNETVKGAVADARAHLPGVDIVTVDTEQAFRGRTLCNDTVWRIRESNWWVQKGSDSWRSPGAVDNSEWVMEINLINAGKTFQQESFHPNYWGQLALRNCWRQVWNGGDVTGGVCLRGRGGLDSRGEPNMDFQRAGH